VDVNRADLGGNAEQSGGDARSAGANVDHAAFKASADGSCVMPWPWVFAHDGPVMGEDGDAIGWIREIVLDCADPWRLARFWAGLLGGTPVEWYPGWVTLEPPPHGQRLSFQGTAGLGASPAGSGPMMHFDVLVADLAAAHDRVVAAGATFTAEHLSPRPGPGGQLVPWRVYLDPAGHPFCLVIR
jgi:hypothetical protein